MYKTEKLIQLLSILKDNNVQKIHVHYDGGGDDGMIHDIEFKDHDNKNKDIIFEEDAENLAFNKLTDDLEEYLYRKISNTVDWDWVNNEGGYGYLSLDINDLKINIAHKQRVVEDYDYYSSMNI